MRKFLDRLYAGGLLVSALCFVAIAVMVLVQICGRLIDKAALSMGAEPIGIHVPSIAELGAFLFAAAAMLSLAGTLRAGGHVRVTMLARALPDGPRRGVTCLVLAIAAGLTGFATWYFGLQAWDSYAYDSVSYGTVRVPLVVPQGMMALGMGLLCVAVIDEFIAEARGTGAAFRLREDAQTTDGDHA